MADTALKLGDDLLDLYCWWYNNGGLLLWLPMSALVIAAVGRILCIQSARVHGRKEVEKEQIRMRSHPIG